MRKTTIDLFSADCSCFLFEATKIQYDRGKRSPYYIPYYYTTLIHTPVVSLLITQPCANL